jgi:hypothetical protein
MRSKARYGLSALASLVLAAAAPAAAASADSGPIQPGQYFQGVFNGHTQTQPYLAFETSCVGPVYQGETGHPLAGQYTEVIPAISAAASDLGFTGSAGDGVVVSLNWVSATGTPNAVVIGAFNDYGVQEAVPATITVPCYGSAKLVFAPVPGSSTGKSATLAVQFTGQP